MPKVKQFPELEMIRPDRHKVMKQTTGDKRQKAKGGKEGRGKERRASKKAALASNKQDTGQVRNSGSGKDSTMGEKPYDGARGNVLKNK